jgi:hypothetical protein
MNAPQDFYTPEELIQRYPQVKMIGWTDTKIGIFFHAGLLIGFQCRKERKALILESSFVELVEYLNHVTLKRQVFIPPKDDTK